MYRFIRQNWRVYQRFFWNPGPLKIEEVYERKLFNINEWLIDKKFKNLSSEEYALLQKDIWEMLKKSYFSSDIYEDLEPTEFAKRTIMNPAFLESERTNSITILSRNITEAQTKSKETFINKYFKHPKISLINFVGHDSKFDIIRKNNLDFDVFIDDEIPNIRTVAENTKDLTEKEFIIPRYGYNVMPKELGFLIESRGGTFTYFDPFKK